MSEYQIVLFRAIDRPLTDKQCDFMDRQSTRAEFTKWEYQVEYHYSEFRGDVDGMLRNGYDIFLTYTNYGHREIRIRLPNGLPFDKSVWSKYCGDDGITWTKDKTGQGGILQVAPFSEADHSEDMDFDCHLNVISKLREMLIQGDLRALYVLWLCTSWESNEDDETLEPPVPHGLGSLSEDTAQILDFFEVDPFLVAAAANGIPNCEARTSLEESIQAWVATTTDTRRSEIVQRLLAEDAVALKAELLSELRNNRTIDNWPVEPPSRTVEQLRESAGLLRKKRQQQKQAQAATKAKREAKKAEEARQARMLKMQAAPEEWLQQASKLVEARGKVNYAEAASILADLRDAVGGEQGQKIARQHAAHLLSEYPTLHKLKSSFRKCGLLEG